MNEYKVKETKGKCMWVKLSRLFFNGNTGYAQFFQPQIVKMFKVFIKEAYLRLFIGGWSCIKIPDSQKDNVVLPITCFSINHFAQLSIHHLWKLEETQTGIKIAGKISITSDMQMTPPLWQKVKGTKKPLDESESGE